MEYVSRKTIRLNNFDYSSVTYYFITICSYEKKCIFGTTQKLNAFGNIVKEEILKISVRNPDVKIDHYVVMPNHIHMILVLETQNNSVSVPQIISLYKAGVSRRIRKTYPDRIIWQRSFYDHVIRNSRDYENIWNYIENNPVKWELDRFYMDI